MRIALRDIFFYGMCQRGVCPSRHHKVPGGVHHHADTIMQESSYLFAQAGERPRLYERLLYSAGHPTSGVRHNDEQEQYNDIVTCVKENYSKQHIEIGTTISGGKLPRSLTRLAHRRCQPLRVC